MQGQEAASAQALQALRAWVRSIASSFPSSHRRRRDTEKPDDKDARPVDETNMDDATTRCFALPPCDLDVTLWRGETVGRGGGKRSLSGGLDVLVTSVPAGSFLKLWKQSSRGSCAWFCCGWDIQVAGRLRSTVCGSICPMGAKLRPGVLSTWIRKYSGSRRHTSQDSRLLSGLDMMLTSSRQW